MSQFNDDFPFEQVMDHPTLEDPGVQKLSKFVGRFPHAASANRNGFQKFRKMLDDVKAPWKEQLFDFTESMLAGTYRGEFGKLYNRYAGGHCVNPECSQTSSLFSLFCQALWYKEY